MGWGCGVVLHLFTSRFLLFSVSIYDCGLSGTQFSNAMLCSFEKCDSMFDEVMLLNIKMERNWGFSVFLEIVGPLEERLKENYLQLIFWFLFLQGSQVKGERMIFLKKLFNSFGIVENMVHWHAILIFYLTFCVELLMARPGQARLWFLIHTSCLWCLCNLWLFNFVD